jgi:hypothetical protein
MHNTGIPGKITDNFLKSKASPRTSSTIAKQGQAKTKNKDWRHKRGMNARVAWTSWGLGINAGDSRTRFSLATLVLSLLFQHARRFTHRLESAIP